MNTCVDGRDTFEDNIGDMAVIFRDLEFGMVEFKILEFNVQNFGSALSSPVECLYYGID